MIRIGIERPKKRLIWLDETTWDGGFDLVGCIERKERLFKNKATPIPKLDLINNSHPGFCSINEAEIRKLRKQGGQSKLNTKVIKNQR